jgi:sulfite exporter TauE/SafE
MLTPEFLMLLPVALILGLAGSGHCLGMCGGIACAFGLQQHERPILALLVYHAGRVATYALLALVFGSALKHTLHHYPLLAPWLRTMAGVLLLLMALQVAQLWSGILQLEKWGNRWWQPIQRLVRPLLPVRHLWQVLVLGALWGWLPCSLVYSTLAWAATRADGFQSAILMATFGAGTTPALLAGGIFSSQLQKLAQQKSWRNVLAISLVGCGVWTVMTAWQHAGHHH